MSITEFLKKSTVIYVIVHVVAIAVTFNVVLLGGMYLIANYVSEPTNLHIIFVLFLASWCTWYVWDVVKFIVKKIIDKLSQ